MGKSAEAYYACLLYTSWENGISLRMSTGLPRMHLWKEAYCKTHYEKADCTYTGRNF